MTVTPTRQRLFDALERLADRLEPVVGQRVLGMHVCSDATIEIIFDRDDDGPNLVSIYTTGRCKGHVALGFVSRGLIPQQSALKGN